MIRRIFLMVILAGSITLFAQEPERSVAKEGAEHSEEGEGGLEVPASLKWANFALLALGLGYMLAKLLPKTFAERTATIQKDIKEAQALKADAEKRASQVEARVASLGADIEKFRAEAAKDMAAEGERIRQETAAHIQRMEAQAAVEIESAGKIARRDLSRYSAELALKLAEDRVRARLDGASESNLVDNFVAELGRQGSNN